MTQRMRTHFIRSTLEVSSPPLSLSTCQRKQITAQSSQHSIYRVWKCIRYVSSAVYMTLQNTRHHLFRKRSALVFGRTHYARISASSDNKARLFELSIFCNASQYYNDADIYMNRIVVLSHKTV